MLKNILLSFIPLFVAVDAIGILPIFVSLTEAVEQKVRTKIIIQSMLTAAGLAIAFVLVGKLVFKFLGITMGDFMIAGGVILFCLAIIDMVGPIKKRRIPGPELGVVPLGTPLIAGPAVLTTSMVLASQFGFIPTIVSILLNVLFAGLLFRMSFWLMKFLGEVGSKALSKVTSLLLAAIAVMLVRKGLEQFL
ncbi:MAG: MarC family protein [Sedimentisphaerales bacterium]|nr:MarC family protein [Sedimentisphaerales bacterium]